MLISFFCLGGGGIETRGEYGDGVDGDDLVLDDRFWGHVAIVEGWRGGRALRRGFGVGGFAELRDVKP